MKRLNDSAIACVLALIIFTINANLLTKAYVFEGLIRALPIETGHWTHLFAGTYLLYGPLGLIFHTILQTLGCSLPAVISLQIMDALLGAMGTGVFYLLLRQLDGDRFASAVWTGILAFTLGYLSWSTDAEDYILSTVLLLTNFFFLVKYAKRQAVDPLLLGAFLGVAILGHLVNVLFGLVGLWFLFHRDPKGWFRPLARYIAGAVVVAGAAYAATIVFVQKPATAHDAWMWFIGSAGAKIPDGISLGGGWTPEKAWSWIQMSLHILISFSPPYSHPPAWGLSEGLLAGAVVLLGVFLLAFGLRYEQIRLRHRSAMTGCFIWLVAYACVFTSWEPGTMVYRVSDLVPLCILLFMGYQSIPAYPRVWKSTALFLLFCLAIGNVGAEIYPRSFATNNPDLQRMMFLKAHTAVGDWITGDGGHDEITIPYFAQRRPIVIERYSQQPQALGHFLQDLQAHQQAVFVTSRVLEQPVWKEFFRGYSLTLIATDPQGFALYRVGRYHEKHA